MAKQTKPLSSAPVNDASQNSNESVNGQNETGQTDNTLQDTKQDEPANDSLTDGEKAALESIENDAKQDGENKPDGEGDAKKDEPAKDAKPEPLTSPKLVELDGLLKTAWAKMVGFTEPDSEEALAANLEVYKIRQDIKAEKANLERIQREQEIIEKRNARIQLATDLVNAVLAERDFYLTVYSILPEEERAGRMEEMNGLTKVAKDKFEIVANELAARYATSAPAKSTGTTDAKVTVEGKGTKSEQIEEMMKTGKTYDQMIAAGMGDGTIRTVAGNIKYKKNSDGTYSPRA